MPPNVPSNSMCAQPSIPLRAATPSNACSSRPEWPRFFLAGPVFCRAKPVPKRRRPREAHGAEGTSLRSQATQRLKVGGRRFPLSRRHQINRQSFPPIPPRNPPSTSKPNRKLCLASKNLPPQPTEIPPLPQPKYPMMISASNFPPATMFQKQFCRHQRYQHVIGSHPRIQRLPQNHPKPHRLALSLPSSSTTDAPISRN